MKDLKNKLNDYCEIEENHKNVVFPSNQDIIYKTSKLESASILGNIASIQDFIEA